MDRRILEHFQAVTAEEQAILNGAADIDRTLYMLDSPDVVNSRKLLAAGKLITIRPSTRFIHFPEHKHDYVEVVYTCSGSSTHIVNGKKLRLEQGELLFLSQSATHEVCRLEKTDITVNFIVLPDFFTMALGALGAEQTPLRNFLVDCLCGRSEGSGYLCAESGGESDLDSSGRKRKPAQYEPDDYGAAVSAAI